MNPGVSSVGRGEQPQAAAYLQWHALQLKRQVLGSCEHVAELVQGKAAVCWHCGGAEEQLVSTSPRSNTRGRGTYVCPQANLCTHLCLATIACGTGRTPRRGTAGTFPCPDKDVPHHPQREIIVLHGQHQASGKNSPAKRHPPQPAAAVRPAGSASASAAVQSWRHCQTGPVPRA